MANSYGGKRKGKFGAAIVAVAAVELAVAQVGRAEEISLLGTELKLRIITQANPRSELSVITFPVSAVVAPNRVEFPDVESLFNPNAPRPRNMSRAVDVAIDAGKDFIEIDFDNAKRFRRFTPAYKNTYVFTFDSEVPVEIFSAEIDGEVTTLGLTPERVTFANNELYVNVQGLRFDTSTFARIKLATRAGDPNRLR